MDFISYIWLLLGATFLIVYLAQKFVADKLNIPSVAIFMVIGVVLGYSGLKLFNTQVYKELGFISDIVLAIISFTIGAELSPRILKTLGKSIILIALGEVFCSAVLVSFCIIQFTTLPLYTALMLGAVAGATAPAATVFVIKRYKSEGKLTSTLLGVVGIDDAFSLILFSIVAVIAENMLSGINNINTLHILFSAATHISLCILFGVLAGIIFSFLVKNISNKEYLLLTVIGFLFILTAVANYFHISQLLTIMIFGITSVALNEEKTEEIKNVLDPIYNLLVPIFFILAASMFDYKIALATFSIGLIYTLARAIGKYGGAYLGAYLGKTDSNTRNFIGIGLFPQVGVAFGLAIVIEHTFGSGQFGQAGKQMSHIISNILIWTTFLTETIGPILTKKALESSGEIK